MSCRCCNCGKCCRYCRDGINGLSAYEIALQNGFIGTEAQWLASLNGTNGIDGKDATILGFADFYSLILGDNSIAPGEDVSFPQNAPTSGTSITRLTKSSFNLADKGVYLVMFQIAISGKGQIILTLNGAELGYTCIGKSAENCQIQNTVLVTTYSINSVLTVRNPLENNLPISITEKAGGKKASSSHLTIIQIA